MDSALVADVISIYQRNYPQHQCNTHNIDIGDMSQYFQYIDPSLIVSTKFGGCFCILFELAIICSRSNCCVVHRTAAGTSVFT